jgi:DNA ligase (NAD+)
LIAVPEIGEKIAVSVKSYFEDPYNREQLNRLKAAGLRFESENVVREIESDRLSGKTFVISGVFEHFERDELKAKIEANGGKVLSGVSGKLNYLVAGGGVGPSKLEKAIKLGVTILSEDEFTGMLTGA